MSEKIIFKADFNTVTQKIKPMHGVGQPPLADFMYGLPMMKYFTRAGIPFSRLHDVGGWMGGGLYVDIPNIFRDFDADENDPASYDFSFTDFVIANLMRAGCEPYFRLGVTIENAHHMIKAYRIFPPKDFKKWARVCEHIVRHYNEGWANGFNFNITYWEIWNEPDDCYKPETSAMWHGTPEEYFELYSITSKHLKECFGDKIKVGGYGHCGLYEWRKDTDLNGYGEITYIYDFVMDFMHGFFKYQKETGAPIDFFSWHVYDNCHPSTKEDFTEIKNHADYIRRILDHYGYKNTEHHLNEWNLFTDMRHRDACQSAAKTLGFMLMMQDTTTDIMCYYDAEVGASSYGGIFNPDNCYPYRNYYTFMMFNTLYKLKNQVSSTLEGNPHVFALAARDGKKAAIVLSNTCSVPVTVELDIKNFEWEDVEILRIDEENRYTLTGEHIRSKTITLEPFGCAEIKMWEK